MCERVTYRRIPKFCVTALLIGCHSLSGSHWRQKLTSGQDNIYGRYCTGSCHLKSNSVPIPIVLLFTCSICLSHLHKKMFFTKLDSWDQQINMWQSFGLCLFIFLFLGGVSSSAGFTVHTRDEGVVTLGSVE